MSDKWHEIHPDNLVHPGLIWRQEMQARGFTAFFVAQRCGVSKTWLNKIMRGGAFPSVELTVKFAEAIGGPPELADLLWRIQAAYVVSQARGTTPPASE